MGENYIVSFLCPDKSVSVVLTKGNRENNKTLEEDTKDTITRYKKDYPDFQISELKKTTLSGIEAYKLVGSGILSFGNVTKTIKMDTEKIFGSEAGPLMEKFSSLPANIISVWTFKDGQEYGVSYANFPGISYDKFSTYLPVATQMMESFEFTNTIEEKTLKTSSEDDNAVQILKERLARGEITIDQYKELLEIIES